MKTEERRAEFHEAVSTHNLKTSGSSSDKPARIIGILLMVVGVVGVFVMYNASLSQSDSRDIASSQILAIAFLALTLAGGAVYVAAAISRVLRLWLLRQLVEGQAQTDQLTAAMAQR